MRCKNPRKAGLINPNHTRIIVFSEWAICFTLWPIYAACAQVKLELNRNALICVYTFADADRIPHFIFMLLTLVGCVVTLFTNIAMWNIVRKCSGSGARISTVTAPSFKRATTILELSSGESTKEPLCSKTSQRSAPVRQLSAVITSVQVKALVTTTIVTSLFLVSWIPTLIRYFMASWPSRLIIPPAYLDKAMTITFSLGCWLNPIIYTVINQGFRDFVRGRIRGTINSLVVVSSQG